MILRQVVPGPVMSAHGSSVATAGSWIAIGMPTEGDMGAVALRRRSGEMVTYEESQTIDAPPSAGEFGADIVFSSASSQGGPFLLIGAPGANTSGDSTGAAYFYVYNTETSIWEMEGSEIVGDSVGEKFGSSVGLSDNYRIVIGAPAYSNNNGRVYTFDFDVADSRRLLDSNWTILSSTELVGTQANALFGSAVDMSRDGNTIVAGEPGTSSFRIFEWIDNDWSVVHSTTLASAVDLGADVVFLSSDFVAVGAPSASDGNGLVLVFERQEGDNTWTQLRQIDGGPGERVGTPKTLGGGAGPNGPELVVATASGKIIRYDIIGDQSFQRFEVSNDTTTAVITAVDVSSDSVYTVLVGYASEDLVSVYEEESDRRTSQPLPTPSPVPAPTQSPTSGITREWRSASSGPLTFSSPTTTRHGAAISWVRDTIVAGLPRLSGLGAAQPYERSANALDVTVEGLLSDSADESESYGAAIDMAVRAENDTIALLVGAPQTRGITSLGTLSVSFGTAYYYESDGLGGWNQIGSVFRTEEAVVEAAGEFGKSVAVASTRRRVVIGAPDTSVNETLKDTGGVSTYDYIDSDWQEVTERMFGTHLSFMGEGLDLSANGEEMVVGSPGVNGNGGRMEYYVWDSNSWDLRAASDGLDTELFGTTTVIIEDEPDGTFKFAVGGPGYNVSQGIVRVYGHAAGSNEIGQIGNDIVGATGERIGTTLSGKGGRLAIGTALGSFYVFDFDGMNWVPVETTATSTGTTSRVVSIALSDDKASVAAGFRNQQVRIFDLVEGR